MIPVEILKFPKKIHLRIATDVGDQLHETFLLGILP